MLNTILKKLLKPWVLKNFPKETKTEIKIKYDVKRITTILVKKGKIKEWRSYDKDHNRIDVIK